MKRYGLASAVAVGLVVGTLVVSCSGDSNSTSPTPGSTVDALGPGLAGGGWNLVVAAAASKSDKVLVCHSGNGKHFTQINVSARGARAHLGDPSSGKGGHDADYRVSPLTPCPPPATPGTVEVCKVADVGVAVGSTFNFALTSDNVTSTVTVAAGAGPNGTCVPAGDFRVGTMVTVTEAAQTGIQTTDIVVSPAGAQQGTPDLPGRSATIIVGVGTTSVTFTNRGPTGTLVICKIGGMGVAAGTNFTFTAGGQQQTVAAGAAPNGTCGAPLTLPVGSVNVAENAVTNTTVQAITGTPAMPTNINTSTRSATVAIVAGQETHITFTNVSP